MKSKTIIQLKNEHFKPFLVAECAQNLSIYGYNEVEEEKEQKQQQNYFLFCEGCFWMASTLGRHPSNHTLSTSYFTKCPVCENKLDRFAIPPIST